MGLGPCCKTALFSPSFFRSVVILVGDPFWWFWKIKKRPVGEGHCVLRGASALFIYYTGWLSSCGCLESLYVVDGTEDWIIFTSRNRVGGLGGKSGPVRQQSKVDRPPALRYGATVYLEPPPRADGGFTHWGIQRGGGLFRHARSWETRHAVAIFDGLGQPPEAKSSSRLPASQRRSIVAEEEYGGLSLTNQSPDTDILDIDTGHRN